MGSNVAYCNLPAAGTLGYNIGNVGVGNLIAPQLGWRYVIEDGDPTSATYGQVLNTCPPAASAVPSSGAWVQGTVVINLNPVPAGTTAAEVMGWRRITTGTGNVLGTDWRQQRVLV